MNDKFEESGYIFDFKSAETCEVFDKPAVQGLKAVDFVIETEQNILFVEVKNFENPNSSKQRRIEDLRKLSDEKYELEIGMKFKDSILKWWAMNRKFREDKPLICLFILEFSKYGEQERAKLKEKIINRIPTGLNNKNFPNSIKFGKIKFDILSIERFISDYNFSAESI